MRPAAAFLFALALPAPAAAQDSADRGARAFQYCISCHSVDAGAKGLPGPNLAGVIGRRAAALADFRYSPALRRAGAEGLVWTVEALDRFIADPLAALPGTDMANPPLRDPALRRAVIEYLARHAR
jgi:cytochrome c